MNHKILGSHKKERFVFLISASYPECDLICQRLRKERIEYILQEYSEAAVVTRYGAQPSIGRKILVPASKIKEAKKILGVKDQILSKSQFRKLPSMPRIICLVAIILSFISVLFFIIISLLGPKW